MSDEEDDGFLSFSAAPIPSPQPKLPKQKPKTSIKKSSQRRQVSQSSTVYGEELFQAAWKPEKSVVVCFHPFTKNYIRFSKDEYAGRFAIKYTIHDGGKFILYNFLTPFEWEFDPEANFEIHIDNSVRVFGPYDELDRVKLKIMSIIRAEVLYSKKKSLEEIRAIENAAKLDAERIENETEQLTEQLAQAGILHSEPQFDFSETERQVEESPQTQKMVSEASEEEKGEGVKVVKDRKGTTIKLTPIEY